MVEYGSYALIEFSMIVDTDMGILRVIDKEYCDRNIFFKKVTSMDSKLLKGMLYQRTMQNPLQVAFKDESKTELMNSIYIQLVDRETEKIINCSNVTSIYTLVKKFIDTEGIIRPTILCNNYYEVDIVKKIFSDCVSTSFDIVLRRSNIYDVSKYTDLFVKDINHLVSYGNAFGKNIFLADIAFNYDKGEREKTGKIVPNMVLAKVFATRNQMRFIELYNYDNSYFINNDYDDRFKNQDDDINKQQFNPKTNLFINMVLGGIPNEENQDKMIKSDIADEVITINASKNESEYFDPYKLFGIPNENDIKRKEDN